jgi:gliding motility-associated-like protein
MDSTYIIDAGYATPNSGQYITQMSTELDSVIWSTVFGSGDDSVNISPTAFLVDLCNRIYLSGWGGGANDFSTTPDLMSSTRDMDLTNNAYQDTTDGSDFYLMVLRDDASGIEYGSYMGGLQSLEHVDGGTSRFDKKGRIYQSVCAGCGGNSDFPIEPNPGAVSSTNNTTTGCNNAVFKIDFGLPITVADLSHPGVVCNGDSVPFTDQSVGVQDLVWEFGDGDTSHASNPTHVYDSSGTFQITLTVEDTSTCNQIDSVKSSIQVLGDTTKTLDDSSICYGDAINIGVQPLGDSGITYQWQPTNGLSDPTEPNPIASPNSTTAYELYISNGICTDTLLQAVQVITPSFSVSNDTTLCLSSDSIELMGASTPPSPIDAWTWYEGQPPGDTLNSSANDSTTEVRPDTTTDYVISGSYSGCELKDTVTVRVSPLQVQVPSDSTICLGDTLSLSAQTDGLGPIHYDWAPDASIIQGDSSQQIIASPDMSTTYSVTVSDDHCSSSAAVTIGVSGLSQQSVTASADQDTILAGSSTNIHADPDDSYDVSWTPPQWLEDPDAFHTEASPPTTTTFELLMTDGGGCAQRDSVRIYVYDVDCKPPDLFIPNAFTPNGDGENDVLYVRGQNIEKMTFRIFDRWGEKVFESHDPDQGWDGTYQGRALDPDVYVYYLEITCVGDKKYFEKGNITLIR